MINKYSIYFFLFGLYSCASITSPTGGPKDEQPPILIESNPVDQQLNVNGDKIILTFDEYIRLNKPESQILITPTLKEKPEYQALKKTVTITLNEKLRDSTTYNISFRESIEDITEGNPAENLKLAFSTGSYIDSLSITGKVVDLFSQEPIDKCIVALYFANDTTDITNDKPSYLSQTNKEGLFSIENLKPAKYRIYAFQDKNNNLLLDFKTEKHGFIADTLLLLNNIDSLTIDTYLNDQRGLKMNSARPSGKYFISRYNKGLEKIILNDTSLTAHIDQKEPTYVKYYNLNQNYTDSTLVIAHAIDSFKMTSIDTFYLKFTESPRKPDPFTQIAKTDPIYKGYTKLSGTIGLSKPLNRILTDSIYIIYDTIKYHINDDIKIKPITDLNFSFHIELDSIIADSLRAKKPNLIFATPSILSIENDTLPEIKLQYQELNQEELGSIEIETLTTKPSYTIQLLRKNLELVAEIKNTTKHSFTNLKPDTYLIRVLIDTDSDGTWEVGNIIEFKESEDIYIYTNYEGQREIELRPNFIIGPLKIEF